jgi:hypothetical protein
MVHSKSVLQFGIAADVYYPDVFVELKDSVVIRAA